MTSITLMFFENVTIRFFDAALFRRLNRNFLEEDEHVGEQATLEFGLLRRQIRRQSQRSRVNQPVVRHFETILKETNSTQCDELFVSNPPEDVADSRRSLFERRDSL